MTCQFNMIFSGLFEDLMCKNYRGGSCHLAMRLEGAAYPPGHALDPRGQVVAPSGVFSVPNILKYSTKNHISFSGHLENFYFQGIFIARIVQKTDRKYHFCFIGGYKGLCFLTSSISCSSKRNPLTRLIKSC